MQLLLNKNFAKNNILDLFLKIGTILILSINISLIIYDIDISSMRNGTLKNSLEDWNVWWSTWTAQIILLASFILLLFHIKLLFSNNGKIENILLLKFIFYLRISTATSALFTLLVFNVAEAISKSLIIYDPVYLRSDIEHIVTPILFIIYYFVTIKFIKFSDKNFFTYFLYSFIFILLYPTFYLINSIFLGIVEKAFPYSEFDWKSEGFLMFFAFLGAAYIGFILFGLVFYLPARIKKKNLGNYNISIKNNDSKNRRLFNKVITINSLITFFFINCFIGIWSRNHHLHLSFFLFVYVIGNLLTLLIFYFYSKNNEKYYWILFMVLNFVFTFGIGTIFITYQLIKNKITVNI